MAQALCEEEVHEACFEEWKELFSRISRFLLDCDRHKNFASPEKTEYICERLENLILTVQRICEVLQVAVDCSENHDLDLLYLVERLSTLGNELLTVELYVILERKTTSLGYFYIMESCATCYHSRHRKTRPTSI